MPRWPAPLLALALLAGCTGSGGPAPACPAGLAPAMGYTAMFGLTMRGQPISTAQWQAFEARELTPRFPAGYSLSEATGSWRNQQGQVSREPSRFFFVLVPAAQAATAHAALAEAMAAYRQAFAQESVGLLVQPGCTSGLF